MPQVTRCLKFDLRDPDLSRIRDIVRTCREGKIIGFPTETVYGIGMPMSIPRAVERLAELKKRPADKPFSYHIGDWDMLESLKIVRTPAFRFLTTRFWPGPLTLVVLNTQGQKIGLRFPRHRITAAIINAAGEPFIATSANLSANPSPHTAEDVMRQFEGQIEIVVDTGRTELTSDSTIVDLTGGRPVILRRGAEAEKIESAVNQILDQKFPRKKILIVCTGNSCRSPMAEGWLRKELNRAGMGDQIQVSSCGIGARNGASATPEAVLVMKNREIDITDHRSKLCMREDVLTSDLILAMSRDHAIFLSGLMPASKEKIRMLDVADPIGLPMQVYEKTIQQIEKKLQAMWPELIS